MKIADLPEASTLASKLVEATKDFEIVSATGLLMMTFDRDGRGGQVAFSLSRPTADRELSDEGILFDAMLDVALKWHRRKIDRLEESLTKLGVEI